MNKAQKIRHCFTLMLALLCLILFNTSCGLDVIYVIEAPYKSASDHTPEYQSTSPDSWYFEFHTFEDTYSGVAFLGTDVYYKIYKSYSNMVSERDNVINLASNNETSGNAATRVTETYKYRRLQVSGYNETVLIPSENQNRRVYIRLTDDAPYEAEIKIENKYLYDSSVKTLPVRNKVGNGLVYDFNFKTSNAILLPEQGDDDLATSGTLSDNTWYVCMFAISMAQDAGYAPVYSNVLYLGDVAIKAK